MAGPKVSIIKSCGGLFLWNRIWDLGQFGPVWQFRVYEFSLINFQCFDITTLCLPKCGYQSLMKVWKLRGASSSNMPLLVEKGLTDLSKSEDTPPASPEPLEPHHPGTPRTPSLCITGSHYNLVNPSLVTLRQNQ